MTSITERAKTLTTNAASLRAEHHKAITDRDALVTRLAAGDTTVKPDALAKANAAVERLAIVTPPIEAQAAEARFLSSLVGDDQGWSSLVKTAWQILSPLGHPVEIVTPDDDIDVSDTQSIFISSTTPYKVPVVEYSTSSPGGRKVKGDPILNGTILGEVNVFGRGLDVGAIKNYLRDYPGWTVNTWRRETHEDWTSLRLVGKNVYPDIPPAAQVGFIGNEASLANVAERLVDAVASACAIGNVQRRGDHSRRAAKADRTSIEAAATGYRIDSRTIDGTTQTIVGSIDIAAWRVLESVGDEGQVEAVVRNAANDLQLGVYAVGRVTDASVSKIGRGRQGGQVYRVTVTGISHVEDADMDDATA